MSDDSTTEVKKWDQAELSALSVDQFFREVVNSMFANDEDRMQIVTSIGSLDGPEAVIQFEIIITSITGN